MQLINFIEFIIPYLNAQEIVFVSLTSLDFRKNALIKQHLQKINEKNKTYKHKYNLLIRALSLHIEYTYVYDSLICFKNYYYVNYSKLTVYKKLNISLSNDSTNCRELYGSEVKGKDYLEHKIISIKDESVLFPRESSIPLKVNMGLYDLISKIISSLAQVH